MVAEGLGVELVDSGPAYSGYMSIRDDSGGLVVEVPVEWNQVDGSPVMLDGTEIPAVIASSDLYALLSNYDKPGVEMSANDISVMDVPAAMTRHAPPECTSVGMEPYEDSAFEGLIEYFTDCAGTNTVYMLLAANYKPAPELIAVVQAKLITDADFDAIVHVLDTFNFV